MESAVPHHLARDRKIARRVSDTYTPPYPAWVARFAESVQGVVMAYFGVQSAQPVPTQALLPIETQLTAAHALRHIDRAHYRDAAQFDTRILIAYWDEPAVFDRWFEAFGAWWDAPERSTDGYGYFLELVRPAVERFETLYSTLGRPEGVAVLATEMSEPIVEHAYWGSARERIALACVDSLTADGVLAINAATAANGRVRIRPQENLCLIRSGQDWSETAGDERAIYLRDIEPALREGMAYLRDAGLEIGCYDCRYVDVLEADGVSAERTFGLAYFREIADMERWAESHPTHLKIFGNFMTAVQRLEFKLALRLYHEVTVAAPHEQFFEYINCHPATGMLRAAYAG